MATQCIPLDVYNGSTLPLLPPHTTADLVSCYSLQHSSTTWGMTATASLNCPRLSSNQARWTAAAASAHIRPASQTSNLLASC
jgi:hypothetical protein